MDIRERIRKMASGEINAQEELRKYEQQLKQEQEAEQRRQREERQQQLRKSNQRAYDTISNRNKMSTARTSFQADNKGALETAKKAEKSKNNFNDFVSKIKENPHKVAPILTDVASSIQASRINSGKASEKEKGRFGTLNTLQGMWDNSVGISSLIINPIAEAEKKIGKAFNNEELYKH